MLVWRQEGHLACEEYCCKHPKKFIFGEVTPEELKPIEWKPSVFVCVRWTKDLPKLQAGMDAGPLLLFDLSGSVLVISAFDNFMAVSYEHDVQNSAVNWGIMGKVNSVPKGFQSSTIMYYGARGINKVLYMCVHFMF